jgi:molybdopterin biosynthesis enzyme
MVQVEDTQSTSGDASQMDPEESSVLILKGVKSGTSVRPTGSDIAKGEVVLTAGTTITPAEVSCAVSLHLNCAAARATMVDALLFLNPHQYIRLRSYDASAGMLIHNCHDLLAHA